MPNIWFCLRIGYIPNPLCMKYPLWNPAGLYSIGSIHFGGGITQHPRLKPTCFRIFRYQHCHFGRIPILFDKAIETNRAAIVLLVLCDLLDIRTHLGYLSLAIWLWMFIPPNSEIIYGLIHPYLGVWKWAIPPIYVKIRENEASNHGIWRTWISHKPISDAKQVEPVEPLRRRISEPRFSLGGLEIQAVNLWIHEDSADHRCNGQSL